MFFARLSLLLLTATHISNASALELSSPPQQITLLELYTSEGCSSCPPADHWLSRLKSDKRLWQRIVPVAFHVDYWNQLGWPDRFSDKRFSQRQRNYKLHNYLNVVYTPGFVKNGREWRGWFNKQALLTDNPDNVGVLMANLSKDNSTVEFKPSQPIHTSLLLNVALLGFDLTTNVVRGENSGLQLQHDFVVLDFSQHQQSVNKQGHHWQLPVINPTQASGIAIWVTLPNDPTPIQATGGFL